MSHSIIHRVGGIFYWKFFHALKSLHSPSVCSLCSNSHILAKSWVNAQLLCQTSNVWIVGGNWSTTGKHTDTGKTSKFYTDSSPWRSIFSTFLQCKCYKDWTDWKRTGINHWWWRCNHMFVCFLIPHFTPSLCYVTARMDLSFVEPAGAHEAWAAMSSLGYENTLRGIYLYI